ncbi:MAG: hemolysin III family protein [Microlunatus sp.]|nr:hemolysin III family protein [Microlunatus sp.]
MSRLAPSDQRPPSEDTEDISHDPGAGPGPSDKLTEVAQLVKPKLRGWLHAGTAPLATAGGIVLVALAPDSAARVAAAVYLAASLLLFGTSAIYHRFSWGPRGDAILRRIDHANIYVFIAGSYTPLAVLLLPPRSATTLLVIVWSSALVGLSFRLLWLSAPRWLYTALYIAMGWAALFWLPQFLTNGGVAVFTLIVVGGLLYTGGAVVYARKRPDPWPRWFGYHEIFHACTILAFAAHYVAISLAMYR